MGDKSLEKFRVEYEKLHRALKKSHESEKRLMQKCRELNAEIVANASKVQTALKLSQEDQTTIASLKKVNILKYPGSRKRKCNKEVKISFNRLIIFTSLL